MESTIAPVRRAGRVSVGAPSDRIPDVWDCKCQVTFGGEKVRCTTRILWWCTLSVMANNGDTDHMFASTNWEWRKVKISAAPARGRRSAASGGTSKPHRPLAQWRRDQVVIEYRGGPECSYLIRLNGRAWRYPGHWCLHDVLSHLAQVVR